MEYNTYNDNGNFNGQRLERNPEIIALQNSIGTDHPNGIFELASTNASGARSVYGLPVYSRNEQDLSFSIDHATADIRNRYLAYQDVNMDAPLMNPGTVLGAERPDPYATSFLLTQTNTADYVDVGNDGPDEKDFGGWTKFGYRENASRHLVSSRFVNRQP